MKDTKLINILRTFSKGEMKQFEKFVASPYFNNGKNCLPLLKLLQKYYPKFDNNKLTYENLYKKLYPGRQFNKQVMWNLSSAMEKMISEFFIQERLKADKAAKYFLSFWKLSEKNFTDLYFKNVRAMSKYVEDFKIGEDSETGYEFFMLKKAVEGYRGFFYDMTDRSSLFGEPTMKRGEYLILSFITNLTQDIYNVYANEKLYNFSLDRKLSMKFTESIDFQEIIRYAKEKNFEYAWVIEFYYYKIMCLLDKENEEHFSALRQMFESMHGKFTAFENYNTVTALVNYCGIKIAAGYDKYKKNLFEINNFRIRNHMILSASGILRKNLYIQMITTALQVDEVSWAKIFTGKYSGNLRKEYRGSMSALAGALLSFHLKEYDRVLAELSKVEFIDVRDKLHVKTLTAKAYFEMNEITPLLNQIDAAKHFLSSNKSVSAFHKDSYGNFFGFLTRLISLKENFDRYPESLLRKDILAQAELIDKDWLLEKLAELEKG